MQELRTLVDFNNALNRGDCSTQGLGEGKSIHCVQAIQIFGKKIS